MFSRIFITGGSGLLGLNIILENILHSKILATVNKRDIKILEIDTLKLNFKNRGSLEKKIQEFNPGLIINAAGITDVDFCESNEDAAYDINANFAGEIADIANNLGIKFLHISTDHLFDGLSAYISEDSATTPLNIYGSSKALGEEKVLRHNKDALVIRCNFFGWGPSYKPSFSDFIYNNLTNNKSINLYEDIFYTPCSTSSLIDASFELVRMDAKGIFNIVGSDRLSKLNFGIKLANSFNLNQDLIKNIPHSSLNHIAKRPSDMSLSNKKLINLLKYDLGDASKNIDILKNQINTNLYKKIKNI